MSAGNKTHDQLIDDGTGYLLASMGDATGSVPFSSLMTTPEILEREREVLVRFVRGLYRAQRWMAARGPSAIAAVLAPAFPDVDPGILARAVARYFRQSTWATDPVLTRTGFDALQSILLAAGFIKRSHRFEDLVDTDIARQAVQTI